MMRILKKILMPKLALEILLNNMEKDSFLLFTRVHVTTRRHLDTKCTAIEIPLDERDLKTI